VTSEDPPSRVSAGGVMAKAKVKLKREEKDGVERSFILIDDRVLPFENSDEINLFVEVGRGYGLTVYCVGPRGASTTASLERTGGKVIEPLKAIINNDYGVSHASDRFTVTQ
jgi:hypothetical protein